MTAIEQPRFTAAERRELEASYRQAISLARSLAKVLGYPCPIADRAERRTTVQDLDDCGTLESMNDALRLRPL